MTRGSNGTIAFPVNLDEPMPMRTEPPAAAILRSILAWRAHNGRLIAALAAGR
jgi:hypothetical protein